MVFQLLNGYLNATLLLGKRVLLVEMDQMVSLVTKVQLVKLALLAILANRVPMATPVLLEHRV